MIDAQKLTAAIEGALQALAMASCPYYAEGGTCTSGCGDEPRCQTCEPTKGWVRCAADVLSAAIHSPTERPAGTPT